jgi:hypothetical protein
VLALLGHCVQFELMMNRKFTSGVASTVEDLTIQNAPTLPGHAEQHGIAGVESLGLCFSIVC